MTIAIPIGIGGNSKSVKQFVKQSLQLFITLAVEIRKIAIYLKFDKPVRLLRQFSWSGGGQFFGSSGSELLAAVNETQWIKRSQRSKEKAKGTQSDPDA